MTPVSRRSDTQFSHPEGHNKISNLMITELLFTHSYMNRGSFQTRRFRRIHLSVFRYRFSKNGFAGPKSFRGFRETCPSCLRGKISHENMTGNVRTEISGLIVSTLLIIIRGYWILISIEFCDFISRFST